MATITKVKCKDNSGYPTELTEGNLYLVSSETETEFFITNDNTILAPYPKEIFNPYYEITKWSEVLPTDLTRGAYGKDTFGNEYEITAIADSKCSIVSKNRSVQNGVVVFYAQEFGDTDRLVSTLEHYGIEIVYSALLTFTDRDDFYTYCVTRQWRVTYPYDSLVPVVYDSSNNIVDMSLEGIVLNFS